jgi:hypothetical protein
MRLTMETSVCGEFVVDQESKNLNARLGVTGANLLTSLATDGAKRLAGGTSAQRRRERLRGRRRNYSVAHNAANFAGVA